MVSVLLVHVLVKITEHSGPVSGFLKSRVLLLECHWNRLQLFPIGIEKNIRFSAKRIYFIVDFILVNVENPEIYPFFSIFIRLKMSV